MAKRKKPRPVKSYISAVDKLAEFAPSLRKYKGRKRLNRWEKAAITRKEKFIGSTQNLFALNKAQTKLLGRTAASDALVGNGVRAVRLRNTPAEAKVSVAGGELKTVETVKRKKGRKKKKRIIRYIPVEADIGALIDKAIEIFDEAGDKITTVWLWLNSGRASGGFRSLPLLLQKLNDNWVPYALDNQRFRGYAVLTED